MHKIQSSWKILSRQQQVRIALQLSITVVVGDGRPLRIFPNTYRFVCVCKSYLLTSHKMCTHVETAMLVRLWAKRSIRQKSEP